MKINLISLIENGELPTIDAIKKSLGSANFKHLENDNYKALAKYLEKHKDNRTAFGISKIYPILLAYALAAAKGDKDSYAAIMRVANKEIHGYGLEDERLREIVIACEAKRKALKVKTVNIADKLAHAAVLQDITHLFDKLTTFEDRILAERLDTAYQIYQHCRAYHAGQFEKTLAADEKKAIQQAEMSAADFLKITLNVSTDKDIHALMSARARVKCYRPEYIPRKHARHLDKLPSSHTANSIAQKNWRRLAELARAHKPAPLLEMRAEKFETDTENQTIFLNALERDVHRVIIKNGIMLKRQHDNSFEIFDTSTRRSHGKEEYVAYTINPEREISVFDHYEIADGYAHSSMNAQGKIIVSGELKVENGVLTHITVYSMHYRPQEENVYEALKIFKDEGVDLAKVTVRLWDETHNIRGNQFIDVNAQDFFNFHAAIEKENEKISIIVHEGFKEYVQPNGESFYEITTRERTKTLDNFFSIANEGFKFPQRRIVDEKPELIIRSKTKT